MGRTSKRRKERKAKRRGRTFRFTREGKVFVAVTLGVGIAAINTGNNLLYLVLGLLLSLLLVSGTLSDLALWRLRIRRSAPKRLFAGQVALFEVSLQNRKKRLPSFSVEVEDLATGEKAAERRCFFLKVTAGASQATTYRRTPLTRGPLVMSHVVARTRYPFGLIEKGQRYVNEEALIVYPSPLVTETPRVKGMSRGQDAPLARPGGGTEVLGLRDYRRGDEAKAIHWRRSAKLDRVVVRETARESRGRLSLLVDQNPNEEADWAESFERMIGRAAYLTEWALGQGLAVEVLTRGGRSPQLTPSSSPDAIWHFLALLEAEETDEDFTPAQSMSQRVVVSGVADVAADVANAKGIVEDDAKGAA